MSGIPPSTREEKASNRHLRPGSAEQMAVVSAKRATDRLAAEADQLARTEVVDGYTIRPAIGRTGGADNVGWELIPPSGCARFLATREQSVAAVERHRSKVDANGTI